MKKPDIQWYTHLYEARRIDFDHPHVLRHILTVFHIDEGLIQRIINAFIEGDRIEVFSLHDATKNHQSKKMLTPFQKKANRSADDIDSHTQWVLFSPRLQIIPRVLCAIEFDQSEVIDDHRSLLNDLSIAAQSWLIARGYHTVNFIDDDGRSLSAYTSLVDPSSVDVSLSPIKKLNMTLSVHSPLRLDALNDHIPIETIVSLAPSNLEILMALEATHRVIACEDSSDLPKHLHDIQRLGPDLDPDLDQVAILSPQLVISSLSVPGMERIVTRLACLGIPQLVLAPRCLNDVMDDIECVAALLSLEDRAQTIVSSLRQQRQNLLDQRSVHLTPVYLEWWPKPMFTPGQTCFSNELIELAGGINVFKERAGSSVEISPSELVKASPKLCFISWCGVSVDRLNPDNLRSRKGLETLNHSAMTHVVPIDESYTGRPGPNMLEASRQMAVAIQEWQANHLEI